MKEEDFTEALNAKDSQLAVLRVRIQESDQELHNKRQQIEEYQLERERSDNIKRDSFVFPKSCDLSLSIPISNETRRVIPSKQLRSKMSVNCQIQVID